MIEDREDLPEIPIDWVWSKLGDVAEIIMGQSPPGDSYNQEGIGVPLINGPVEFGRTAFSQTIKSKFTTLPTKMCKEGDLILCVRGSTTGRMNIAGFEACIGRGVAAIRSQFYQQYLNIFINFNQYQIYRLGTGSTFPNVSADILGKIPIPLPPLNEQRRIVTKIEALKARSQRVKEALEAIPLLLDQFRQSVLAAAFRGDLTADWREKNSNVEPASVLLERIQEKLPESKNKKNNSELPEPFQIPETWKWVSLSDICNSITDGDHQPPPKSDRGVPFLVISNISNSYLDFSNIRYVPEEYYRSLQEHRKAKKGDIVYSVVGSYGIPVLVDTEEKFCFQRHIALLKPSHLIDSKYLLYTLKSDFVFRQATEVATGTTQLTVTLSGLRKIKIPLIPLPEQQEIINKVETLLTMANTIEQQYQKAKTNLNQLDQSILAKAFRGELVPQDPNDEPASVLLERIRTERAKLQAKTKTAKKSPNQTGDRRKKPKPQDAEPVQLELGLE